MKKKNKEVTILGGSGYIGSHVADLLSYKGFYVKILDTQKSKWLKNNQKMFIGSILDKKKLAKAINNSHYVFNFAALANIDKASHEPFETANINILGTINILQMCKKFNIKKIIHASSIYANSEQGGFYGCSKKASEDYVERFYQKYNLNFTTLRFGSLYGERADVDNGLQKLINLAKTKKQIHYAGTKKAARRYIHVQDAAKACFDSIHKKHNNQYLTVTGMHKIKITNVVKIIKNELGITSKNIKFLNKKDNTHYINEPKRYKPRQGKKILIKTNINFKKSIIELLYN